MQRRISLRSPHDASLQFENACVLNDYSVSVFRSVCLYERENIEGKKCIFVRVCAALYQGAFLYAASLCLEALNKWETEQKALAGLLVY